MDQITILRLPAVMARTGLSRSSIYLKIAQGTFEPPLSLGARSVGWKNATVDRWLAGLVPKPSVARSVAAEDASLGLEASVTVASLRTPALGVKSATSAAIGTLKSPFSRPKAW